ncbi:hypothetical protein T4B_5264, partial [Trichinella pseudospiralis]
LGQLRLTKAMKTTASAERVTTTSALKAKIEPRLNSCAVCKGEHTITEYKRRQMSDGVCALSEDCVIISSIKVIWPIGAPEENPVVKRHHRLLHQPGTKEMTPMRDQIAAEDHRIVE